MNIYKLLALWLILYYLAPTRKTRALTRLLPGRRFSKKVLKILEAVLKKWLG